MQIPWPALLILFPLTCAVIGWITNIIAVRMLFRPLEPVRLLGLKFQGVLPKHQAHFAHEMGQVITTDFITTAEMVGQLDVERLVRALRPLVDRTFEQVVQELRQQLTEQQRALVTDEVVQSLRDQVEQTLEAELPQLAQQVRQQADTLVDLTELVARKLIAIGPAKLEQLIRQVAQRELTFIEIYGGIFGFLIGLVQFGLIAIFPVRYSLPVVGLVVGLVTNYLAIQMLFYPRHPMRVLGLRLQGLFPKRQQEIGAELATLAANDFVVAKEVFQLLMERIVPRKDGRAAVQQVETLLAERFPGIKAMLEMVLTSEQQDAFRDRLAQRYTEMMPPLAEALVREAADQLDLRTLLADKVAALSKLRFEGLIRGLFKQEELYLVLYGALLGGLMGTVQLGLLLLSGRG